MSPQTAVYEQWRYIQGWLRQTMASKSALPKDVWHAISQYFQASVGVCVYTPTIICVE
jgi:hypothetical protein